MVYYFLDFSKEIKLQKQLLLLTFMGILFLEFLYFWGLLLLSQYYLSSFPFTKEKEPSKEFSLMHLFIQCLNIYSDYPIASLGTPGGVSLVRG